MRTPRPSPLIAAIHNTLNGVTQPTTTTTTTTTTSASTTAKPVASTSKSVPPAS